MGRFKIIKQRKEKVMIKGLIIDWDNCVFDTRSMGEGIVAPIIEAALKTGDNIFFRPEKLRLIKEEMWIYNLEDVILRNQIPAAAAEAMRIAYLGLEAPANSKNYGDIQFLESLPQKKILVTSGLLKFQLSKIIVTGSKDLFDEIIIDSVDNPSKIKGKTVIFKEIMARHGWQPREAMVVGDNPSSELSAGKELGMFTAQMLRPGVSRAEGFDYYVSGFEELAELLNP
jgi:putative hydrolase of the HAD superfamily